MKIAKDTVVSLDVELAEGFEFKAPQAKYNAKMLGNDLDRVIREGAWAGSRTRLLDELGTGSYRLRHAIEEESLSLLLAAMAIRGRDQLLGLGNRDLHPTLEHRRGDDEDDQEGEGHIHQRRDVDLRLYREILPSAATSAAYHEGILHPPWRGPIELPFTDSIPMVLIPSLPVPAFR